MFKGSKTDPEEEGTSTKRVGFTTLTGPFPLAIYLPSQFNFSVKEGKRYFNPHVKGKAESSSTGSGSINGSGIPK